MRRSEAVEKLAKWYKAGNIGGHVFAIPNVDSMPFYREKTEILLDFLEKEIGLLPPQCVKKNIQGSKWEVNEWELEND